MNGHQEKKGDTTSEREIVVSLQEVIFFLLHGIISQIAIAIRSVLLFIHYGSATSPLITVTEVPDLQPGTANKRRQ